LKTAKSVLRSITSTRASVIRVVLLSVGSLSLVSAVVANSQILAFIGLGLAFWGALFFLITPLRYVEGSLLSSTAISSYQTINRIVRDLKVTDYAYYVPPFPKNTFLPDHLRGLKEMVVFVPEGEYVEAPSIEEMANSRFLLEKPKGILIIPPGGGLLNKIENDFQTDFNNMDLTKLCEILPRYILENLGLAEEMEMNFQEGVVNVRVRGSLYKGLYSDETNFKSLGLFGCPIISAAACALAKASGKFVSIKNLRLYPSGEIEAQCSIIRGQD
jgi:hypothetical protein